jgi:hypothetical protein
LRKWVQRLLLAEHYQQGRVFIAGDAPHLVIPTGGLGMNTGVGDAIDISWKLAATLRGWGGPKLLQSYEAERRPIGAINVKASGGGTAGRMKWRTAYRPNIEDDTPERQGCVGQPAGNCERGGAKTFRVIGAELGYRYAGSPVICDEPGRPAPNIEDYVPTSWPGARLPHVWLVPVRSRCTIGSATGSRFCGSVETKTAPRVYEQPSVPSGRLSLTLDIDSEAARRAYDVDYLLVRPDLHVCWRGDALPKDPDRVARVVTGH